MSKVKSNVYARCNVDGPYIALTFDDGPHKYNTSKILETLKNHKVLATFFCIGQHIQKYPLIAKRIVADGHEIANHSWSHQKLTALNLADELDRTHTIIKDVTGITAKVMRPPHGALTEELITVANVKWGYRCIRWNVESFDWKKKKCPRKQILAQCNPGSIILCHDLEITAINLPSILQELCRAGYKFITVSELINRHELKIQLAEWLAAKKAKILAGSLG